MAALTQKKISISSEQKQFLEHYRQWGFTDQSSIVREALFPLYQRAEDGPAEGSNGTKSGRTRY